MQLSLLCILFFTFVNSDLAEKLSSIPKRPERCTSHADCLQDECCVSVAREELAGGTKVTWQCRPLGSENSICHSLSSNHCPCRPGLQCQPKGIWFFGAGVCTKP